MSSLWTPDGERPIPPRSDGTESDDPGSDTTGFDSGSDTTGFDSGRTAGDTTAQGTSRLADPLRAAAEQLGVDLDSMSEEDISQLQAETAEMMRVRREVAETPAHDMLANHMMRLFDLALIYLEADPPSFSDAATVIESFRAILDNVGDRLGQNRSVLSEALSQLQMVFVQVKEAAEASTHS